MEKVSPMAEAAKIRKRWGRCYSGRKERDIKSTGDMKEQQLMHDTLMDSDGESPIFQVDRSESDNELPDEEIVAESEADTTEIINLEGGRILFQDVNMGGEQTELTPNIKMGGKNDGNVERRNKAKKKEVAIQVEEVDTPMSRREEWEMINSMVDQLGFKLISKEEVGKLNDYK